MNSPTSNFRPFESTVEDFARDEKIKNYVSLQYQHDYDTAPWIVTVTIGDAFMMQRFLLKDDALTLFGNFKKEFKKG